MGIWCLLSDTEVETTCWSGGVETLMKTSAKIGNWGYLQISPVRDEFRRMSWKKGANEIGQYRIGYFWFLLRPHYSYVLPPIPRI
jgi:hypothetical protein